MRKVLGGVVTAFMSLCFLTNGVSAKQFSDLPSNHWARNEINALAKDNVVVGYPGETFRPEQPVTKAEFVTMVIKALWQENYEHELIYYYKDVPADHWAHEMIQIASEFDLLKGYSDGFFKPDENLKKAEAVKIVISAVDAGEVTEPIAKRYLSVYKDANKIPASAILSAGKAVKYSLIANPPSDNKYFNPTKLITRAEMSVMLFNMREQALLHPNNKLKKVFTPKSAQGIVLEKAEMEPNGFIAVIPEGTILEGLLIDEVINSQEAVLNKLHIVKTQENYVTRQNYLLLPAGTNIAGEIVDIKKAKYFIRNANLGINAKRVIIEDGHSGELDASMSWNVKKPGFFARIYRAVVKGKKIVLNPGDVIYVKLTRPVRIDTAKTMVLNP